MKRENAEFDDISTQTASEMLAAIADTQYRLFLLRQYLGGHWVSNPDLLEAMKVALGWVG